MNFIIVVISKRTEGNAKLDPRASQLQKYLSDYLQNTLNM